jgi:hypothetical protein
MKVINARNVNDAFLLDKTLETLGNKRVETALRLKL